MTTMPQPLAKSSASDPAHPWTKVRTARRQYLALADDSSLDAVGPALRGKQAVMEAVRGAEVVGTITWNVESHGMVRITGDEDVQEFLIEAAQERDPDLITDIDELNELHADQPFEDEDEYGNQITAGVRRVAYPDEHRKESPYGQLPNGRGRNRPPSLPGFDPSEIIYEFDDSRGIDSVSAIHPETKEVMGNYSWEHGQGNGGTIHVAMVDPQYQGIGIAGGILDHIREEFEPELKHSLDLSLQGRAGSLRDWGNTKDEHAAYYNVTPFNVHASQPATFQLPGVGYKEPDEKQVEKHKALQDRWNEEESEGRHSMEIEWDPWEEDYGSSIDRNYEDAFGDPHEYGYDEYGDYVGLEDGGYNSDGEDEEGFDVNGYQSVDWSDMPDGTMSMEDMSVDEGPDGGPLQSEFQHEGTREALQRAMKGEDVTAWAVVMPGERSRSGNPEVGNGQAVYTSRDAANAAALRDDNMLMDGRIIEVEIDPQYLFGNPDAADELNANSFVYAGGDERMVEGRSFDFPRPEEEYQNYLGPDWKRAVDYGGSNTWERESPDGYGHATVGYGPHGQQVRTFRDPDHGIVGTDAFDYTEDGQHVFSKPPSEWADARFERVRREREQAAELGEGWSRRRPDAASGGRRYLDTSFRHQDEFGNTSVVRRRPGGDDYIAMPSVTGFGQADTLSAQSFETPEAAARGVAEHLEVGLRERDRRERRMEEFRAERPEGAPGDWQPIHRVPMDALDMAGGSVNVAPQGLGDGTENEGWRGVMTPADGGPSVTKEHADIERVRQWAYDKLMSRPEQIELDRYDQVRQQRLDDSLLPVPEGQGDWNYGGAGHHYIRNEEKGFGAIGPNLEGEGWNARMYLPNDKRDYHHHTDTLDEARQWGWDKMRNPPPPMSAENVIGGPDPAPWVPGVPSDYSSVHPDKIATVTGNKESTMARRRIAGLIPGTELTAGDVVEQNGQVLQVVETRSSMTKDGEPMLTLTLEGESGNKFTSEFPVGSEPPEFNLVDPEEGGGEMDPAMAEEMAAMGMDPAMMGGDPGMEGGGDPMMEGPPEGDPSGGMGAAMGDPGMDPTIDPAAMMPPGEGYDQLPMDPAAAGEEKYDDLPVRPMARRQGKRTASAPVQTPEDRSAPVRTQRKRTASHAPATIEREADFRAVASPVEDFEFWTRQHDLNPATSLKEYDQTHRITQEEYDQIQQEVMQDAGIVIEGEEPEDFEDESFEIEATTSIDSGTDEVGPAFPDMNDSIHDAPEGAGPSIKTFTTL